MNCPASWVRSIAQHVKTLAPTKLFVDGTYGINKTHLSIPEVDIYSDHFYPVDLNKLKSGIEAVRGAGKVYFAGEYDWVGSSGILEASDAVAGDTFWSLFGRNGVDCSVSFLLLSPSFFISSIIPN
jgi:mannan endo-1,4-beta-mannosidase